tara:strand:- start:470 stop:1720 length:1251 start_codon:yes stop_codon:yes gene_type:complete
MMACINKAVLPVWIFVVLCGAQLAPAYATENLTLEATFSSVANGWAQVERWHDTDVAFQPEDYPGDGRMNQTGQRLTFFGAGQPESGQFLLYHAPGWDSNSEPTPVLLVHGAFENADWAWANPAESPLGCGATSCPTVGLMQHLSGLGRKVFAISYPHAAGDNYYWAEQINDAIEIIKSKTSATQVDVVAWSKGTVASRMFASNVHKGWGTPYASSIRRLILVGGLNNGWDWPFRHGVYPSWAIFPECGGTLLGGSAHTNLNCFGIYFYHPELSIYDTGAGDFFPGLKQMLSRWDSVYWLPVLDPDYWSTYYGGWGYYSYSNGINFAINQGSLIDTMRTAGTPSSIPTYLLCGGAADIPNWHNEHTGPSDGTVFVASCSDTGGIGTVAGSELLGDTNHLELVWENAPMAQIESWLQ